MEKEISVVDFMSNELLYLDNEFDMKLIDKNEYQARRKQIIAQAKAMEKENIKQTWQESRKIKSECSNWNCIGDEKFHESFEQYYNETFKSE